ncbi:MAG: GNAT family N-acetyltransferase [Spirochaetales bacterium]|nr:GNAT family N-acetyltransferase [Spirochaetales bacterium]
MQDFLETKGLDVRWYDRFHEIPEKAYRQLAGDQKSPFLDYNWLCWLEDSGSVSPVHGWEPRHLALWQGSELRALAPLWLRNHSWGEFVFDFMWADAAAQLGVPYYPKLVGMSPLTPSDAYYFLVAPHHDSKALSARLWQEIQAFMDKEGIVTCAFNWVDKNWTPEMRERGFLLWEHQSYLWTNPGFHGFEDYLEGFSKNQRRNIRRERQKIVQAGLEVRVIQGSEITEKDFLSMYGFYKATNDRFGPWAAKFLNQEFFKGLQQRAAGSVVLFAAYEKNGGKALAMSMLLFNKRRLIGRYWGSRVRVDSLHFELCYYAPIQWAIEQGILEFDPGFGSPHKVRRGFRAVSSHSLHYFTEPLMTRLMENYLYQLNQDNQEQIDYLNSLLPLK